MEETNNEIIVNEETGEIIAEKENTAYKSVVGKTMWNDRETMMSAWKLADMLSKSTLVPQAYKGNVGNCLIALDIANRMGMSPIMVMQNSQVVQGRFTWIGSACKGLIDSCGRYKNSEYVWVGEPNTPEFGCYLTAVDVKSEKVIKGTTVTLKMANDEGWSTKVGSKWKTMPELMLQYRAATFFARTNCPEALMGFYTNDEMFDITKTTPKDETQTQKVKISLE